LKFLLLILVLLLGAGAYYAGQEDPDSDFAPALAQEPRSSTSQLDTSVETVPVERETLEATPHEQNVGSRTVTAIVSVTSGRGKQSRPEPLAECEFGVGLGLTYMGNPPMQSLRLATGTCNSDGRLTVELEVPETWFERTEPVFVWGIVLGSGLQARYKGVRLPADDEATVELKLRAISGSTLNGVVLSPDGRPAAGAELQLLSIRKDPDRLWPVRRTASRTDGLFTFHFDDGGPHHVLARMTGAGTASVRDLEIDISDPPMDLELRLAGSGELRGQVLDPSGEPVRLYKLWARPAPGTGVVAPSLPMRNTPHHVEGWERVPSELAGRGVHGEKVVTDEDGRFYFPAMLPGQYDVCGWRESTGDHDRVLTAAPVATGGEDLVLTVERRVLVLHVVSHEDRPVQPTLTHDPTPYLRIEDAEPEHALFFLRCDTDGQVLEGASQRFDRQRMSNGEIVVEVEAGASYAFGIVSKQVPLFEDVIDIAEDRWLTRRTIRLGEPQTPGDLLVTVETPEGEHPWSTENVAVLGPQTGVHIENAPPTQGYGPTYSSRLPAGDYVVEVTPHQQPTLLGGGHAQAKIHTKVRPGARTEEVLTLGKGGVLRLTVTQGGSPDDTRWPSAVAQETWLSRRRDAKRMTHTRLTTVRNGKLLPDPFVVRRRTISDPTGQVMGEWLAVGESYWTEILPIGEYQLRVQSKGYPPHEQRVMIVYGQTTELDVVLKPE